MTKHEIHQRFIDRLAEELAAITAAAKNSIATATSQEHQAESKYDTFSLESSYLARGQAKRVEELTYALERLQSLVLKELHDGDPIQHSALVRLETGDGKKRTLFFCPAGGGEQIADAGEDISIITALSPLGKAMLGKAAGATFNFAVGKVTHAYTVVSVE